MISRATMNLKHVRFGSKADICGAKRDVRFTPNSDRESGLRQTTMSALPPIADMCGANSNVCFGPKADSCSAAKRIAIRSPRRRGQVQLLAVLLPPSPTATLPARAYGLAVPRDGDLARIFGVSRLVTLATTNPVASAVSRVFAFFHAGGAVNRR